ncbi:fibrobacter succinogenes major paralogous domain-containing protein [Fibrobacter sp. UWB7]|uniref:fibrobacter succinogenes major paralogous domain-containing protein n=1 Tax=Fibrobacter sp. UWB7 TaxID=1896206 RepID=UPI000920C972|nr:fibrobacter succinogenes major paralogous domain-containing protein [Fibrobacter sp. UWB7]SHM99062.1 major paralogous domain-containing protein [Fibrobacter sp. UWB7]
MCEDGDWTPDSDENVDKKSSSSGKASSSSSKKTQSSSSSDKAKSSSSGKVSSSSVSKASSSSSGKETSSSSFKYEQDSSAYVQPKVVAVKNKSISGVSQKGPFVTGSTIKLYELDGKKFAQTGKSFSGKISSDDGKFSVSSVSLASQYASLEATGYFRNEVTGEKSKGTITLNALTDLSDRKNVNINLLTHLEYERVLHLIESGINFTAAKKQAEAEILNAFGIKGEFANSEDLDIFGKGDGNAALLAFSVLMLGGTVDEYSDYKELSEAELTERLTKFATDIAKDGSWDDENTKATIADRAAAYSRYEADDYYRDYNGFSNIRQSIEKWNLGAVPVFEKYVRNFWTDVYGLGKCDSKNEGKVVATKNKLSNTYDTEFSNTYGTKVRFICKEGTWKHASDLEKDTYQWAAGKDGEIKVGDITKQKYDYDGKLKKWRYAIGAEVVLGGCTEAREKDFSKNTGKAYGAWYICKNREWKGTDSTTVDTQAWGPGDDGELRKGDSTSAIYKYDEDEKKWLTATKNDTMLKLNGCTVNRIYEVSKSPFDDMFYVCDSVFYSAWFGNDFKDTVKMDWRKATSEESVLGVCTETREKDFSKNTGRVNSIWYICKNRKWEMTDRTTVDTQGWSKGKDGELRRGDSTDAVYKYDEYYDEWLSVISYRDSVLELNGCTRNRNGEVGRSPFDDTYYKCSIYDTSYYNKECYWIIATEVEYNTYGKSCTATEVGKIIDGVVIDTNRYYCTADGWINLKDWSWGVSKELRVNPEITYGSMTDSRDNKVYKTVKIGNQVWMAENLNYADSVKTPSLKGKSWCYDNKEENCFVAGRLYTWTAAIDSVMLYDDGEGVACGYGVEECQLPEKIQGVCPPGWHLPTGDEWKELIVIYIGGGVDAGKKLKSQTGWNGRNGADALGFCALPVGYSGNAGRGFSNAGQETRFWGFERDGSPYYSSLNSNSNLAGFQSGAVGSYIVKNYVYSVRCLKD